MKGTMTVAISALLLVALVACGGASDPVVGSYKFSSVSARGVEIDLGALRLDTSAWKLDINDDGTFTIEVGDLTGYSNEMQTASGTWEKDGDNYNLVLGGDSAPVRYDDSAQTITFDAGGDRIFIFKKQ